jgi:hypothetical protein
LTFSGSIQFLFLINAGLQPGVKTERRETVSTVLIFTAASTGLKPGVIEIRAIG